MAFDQVSHATTQQDENSPRFIIGVDYGTTYTGVAWVLTTGEVPTLNDVNVVHNWSAEISEKVPSKFTYSANQGEKWGFGIGNNAYVIQRTKLELERPDRELALDRLRRTLLEAQLLGFSRHNVLRNQLPRHLIKTPQDVVTDYLTNVACWVRRDIESKRDKDTLRQFPVDLVITHPAVWDKRAKNLTFRAATTAFDNVFIEAARKSGYIRLASESEACAQYTMRDPEAGAVNDLRKGQCFIVVDAGGGTVDLAAYRVEEVAPRFRVSLATKVTGRRCGSTCIDDYFLRKFLPTRLSPYDLPRLAAFGGQQEQHGSATHEVLRRGEQMLLDRFITLKHSYVGWNDNGEPSETDWIELPPGIGTEDNMANNIRDGQLGITCKDMEDMFRDSVDGTIQLINEQLVQIDVEHLTVGAIFLSGGFSRSEYLYKRIKNLAQEWGVDLFRSNDSWTAVAKGAALMGLGIGCGEIPPPNMKCPFHVGVVASTRFADVDHDPPQKYVDTFDGFARARDQIRWLIAKGDLVTHDQGIEERLAVVRKVKPTGKKTGTIIVVTSQYDRAGEPPSKLKVKNDPSRRLWNVDFDLSQISADDVVRHPAKYRTLKNKDGVTYNQVEMELEISVTQLGARVDLVWGRTEGLYGGTGVPGYVLHSRNIAFPA